MAHKFAMASERITGEMVEAIEFPEMANRWNVMSVPHVVINEDVQFVGALPEEEYLKEVLKAATASRP
jgi:predicted DsbA family dithiol-disulfide isomerase